MSIEALLLSVVQKSTAPVPLPYQDLLTNAYCKVSINSNRWLAVDRLCFRARAPWASAGSDSNRTELNRVVVVHNNHPSSAQAEKTRGQKDAWTTLEAGSHTKRKGIQKGGRRNQPGSDEQKRPLPRVYVRMHALNASNVSRHALSVVVLVVVVVVVDRHSAQREEEKMVGVLRAKELFL